MQSFTITIDMMCRIMFNIIMCIIIVISIKSIIIIIISSSSSEVVAIIIGVRSSIISIIIVVGISASIVLVLALPRVVLAWGGPEGVPLRARRRAGELRRLSWLLYLS